MGDDKEAPDKADFAVLTSQVDRLIKDVSDGFKKSSEETHHLNEQITAIKQRMATDMVGRAEFNNFRERAVDKDQFALIKTIVLGGCGMVLVAFLSTVILLATGWKP